MTRPPGACAAPPASASTWTTSIIEPSVSLSWVNVDIDDYTSNGATIVFDDISSFRGAAGVRFGGDFRSGNGTFSPFIGIYAVDEFEGDARSTFTLGQTIGARRRMRRARMASSPPASITRPAGSRSSPAASSISAASGTACPAARASACASDRRRRDDGGNAGGAEGFDVRIAWRRDDARLEADAIALWERTGILPGDVTPAQRAKELVAGAYQDGQLISLCTAVVEPIPFLRARFVVLRSMTDPDHRRSHAQFALALPVRKALEDWALAHPEEKAAGVIGFVEPGAWGDFDKLPVAPIWPLTVVAYAQ